MNLGSISSSDLLVLVNLFPPFEKRFNETRTIFRDNPDVFASSDSIRPSWYEFYEIPFAQHVAEIVVIMGQLESTKELAASENPVKATINYSENQLANFDSNDEDGEFDIEDRPFLQLGFGYGASLYFSYKSLLTFGLYLNELVEMAGRERNVGDKALFQAVKIDPTVIACQNIVTRIGQAVLENDSKFLGKLKRAMLGKLTKREDKTYQKQRLVLQVLLELGVPNLSQEDLYELFVEEMNIVGRDKNSDVGDVANNLRQFAYQFLKQKSVSQK